MRFVASVVVPFLALPAVLPLPASAQSITIDAIRAQLVQENSGTLSENIVGSKKAFANLPAGGSGDPANMILVTLVFKGPAGKKSSDQLARDLANVSITQRTAKGNKVLLKRAYGNFTFSDAGVTHRAVLIEDATCNPLEIDVKIARSQKTERLVFKCDEVKG